MIRTYVISRHDLKNGNIKATVKRSTGEKSEKPNSARLIRVLKRLSM